MKQMKKLLALLLALTMALALAACGSQPEKTLDEPQPEEQVEEQAETEKSFERGKVEGSTYTNEGLGMTLALDEDWKFLNDEEIGELTGTVQDMSDSEEIRAMLENGAALYDMYATTGDATGRRINITVSDLGALSGKLTTEEAYAAAVAEQLKPGLESVGAENVEIELTAYTLAGVEHSGMHIDAEMQGVKLCESMTFIKVGDLVYNVTCTAQSEEELAAVMELFQAL